MPRVKCPYCGAEFNAPSGVKYIVCPYCGTTILAETGERAENQYYYPARLADNDAFLLAMARASMLPGAPSDIAERAVYKSAELHYLPLYICRVEASVPECGEQASEHTSMAFLALKDPPLHVPREYRFPAVGRVPYDPREAARGKFYQPDVNPDHKCVVEEQRLRGKVLEEARIAGCKPPLSPQTSSRVEGIAHYPVWRITYSHPAASRDLEAVVDAVDAQLIYLEYPIPLVKRAMLTGAGLLALIIGVAVGAGIGVAIHHLVYGLAGGFLGGLISGIPAFATSASRIGRHRYRVARVERTLIREEERKSS